MPPVIAISSSPSHDRLPHGNFLRHVLASNYVDAVVAAGGVPVILPPSLDCLDDYLRLADGLIFSGGGDVDPSRYGAVEAHPETYGLNPTRDRFELALIHAALEQDLPILAICRGLQVLNVALGGTLIQDIPAQHPTEASLAHRQHEAGLLADDIGHEVLLAPGWPLPAPTGAGSMVLGVNSFHHQAIDRLGSGLAVVARAPDGLAEAVTLPDRAFVFGVQWHPELMFARHPEHLEPFLALVYAATTRLLTAADADSRLPS